MRTTYDRSISTGVCAVTTSYGGTTYTKYVYTPVSGDPSRIQYEDFYYGDLTQYERFSFEYNGDGDLTKQKGPGNVTLQTFSYTTKGRMSTETFRNGTSRTYEYASAGALYPTRRVEPDGTYSGYEYDSMNRVTKTTHSSVGSAGRTFAYDAYGQLTSVTDPLGNSMTYAYDSMGNCTSMTDPLSNSAHYYFDDYGNMTRTTDRRGKNAYMYYAYSGCGGCGATGGILTKVRDALNNETEYRYDVNGNVTKVIDALDREADYAYDAMGRMTQVTSLSGSGNSMGMSYDLLGRVTHMADFDGKIVLNRYDHRDRLTWTWDYAESITKQYTYNSLGQLSTVTDGEGQVFTYAYYSTGHLHYVNYNGTGLTRHFYDSAGRATKVGAGLYGTIDPTEYFYDNSRGQLTKVRYTSGANTYDANYYYDDAARFTKLTDWIDGTDGLRYAYDEVGRLTRLTDYDDSHLDYTYDAAGNVLTMNNYHSHSIYYTYTDTGQVSTVTAPGSKTWTYAYNAVGQATGVSIPNGMTTEYGYDTRNRLTAIEHKDGASVLDGFTYALTGKCQAF